MSQIIILFLVLWVVVHMAGFFLSYAEWNSLKHPEFPWVPAGRKSPKDLARETLAFLFQVGFFYILYRNAKPMELLRDAGFLSSKENKNNETSE